jgi:hypothetical protein
LFRPARGLVCRFEELSVEDDLNRFHMWSLFHSILHTLSLARPQQLARLAIPASNSRSGQAGTPGMYQLSNTSLLRQTVFDAVAIAITATIKTTLNAHGNKLCLSHAWQTKCSDLRLPPWQESGTCVTVQVLLF